MICLLILLLSCQSTNYYEVAMVKNEILTKRQGNYINDISDYRTNNRTNNYDKEKKMTEEEINEWFDSLGKDNKDMEIIDYEGDEQFTDERVREEEVKSMEDINSIVTALGSAIAGVYCLIKTIIAAIKKAKKN